MKSYSWFKLRLDQGVHIRFDEPDLSANEGSGMLILPRGKSAREVSNDYLRGIYRNMMIQLNKMLGERDVRTTKMDFWFNVPAI